MNGKEGSGTERDRIERVIESRLLRAAARLSGPFLVAGFIWAATQGWDVFRGVITDLSDNDKEIAKSLSEVVNRVDKIDLRNQFHAKQIDRTRQELDGHDRRLRRVEQWTPAPYRGTPRSPDEEHFNGR